MTTSAVREDTAYEDPRITRSRAVIMEAAAAVFLARGYAGTSVDDVAAAAGVSKRTVYNVFGDKEALFRAILGGAIATAEEFAGALATADDEASEPGVELAAIGLGLVQSLLGGRVVALRRLLIAEAVAFPDLAADYYGRAPARVMAAIADVLRRLDAGGRLAVPDPERAAEQFAFLVIGASLDHALFSADAEAAIDLAEQRMHDGVAVFLRAHAVDR